MSTKKYLDLTGLQEVAGKVNSRLKTVTEMPVSADNGAVRLYVGTTTSSYTQGHIYQYSTTELEWVDLSDSGGGSSTASDVSYDNTDSGLTATNVQDAVDELKTDIDNIPSVTVDQTYDGTSVNAQSGVAVKQAIDAAITSVLDTRY